jgi:hypothetical protein
LIGLIAPLAHQSCEGSMKFSAQLDPAAAGLLRSMMIDRGRGGRRTAEP